MYNAASNNANNVEDTPAEREIRSLLSCLIVERISMTVVGAEIPLRGEAHDRGHDIYTSCIFENADAFVKLSSGNTMVQEVRIHPFVYSVDGRSMFDDYSVWEKVGRGVGNLQSLQKITIDGLKQERTAPDWEAVACILRQIHRPIEFCIEGIYWEGAESMESYVALIWGNPHIKAISLIGSQCVVPRRQFGMLLSALSTLPALKSALLTHEALVNMETGLLFDPLMPPDEDHEDTFHDSMTEFLQSPTLRNVKFETFYCTDQVCRAIANGLSGECHVTSLVFQHCMFPNGGGGGDIIRALQTNTSVEELFLNDNEHSRSMFDALNTVLSVNTTLLHLEVRAPEGEFINSPPRERSGTWLAPLFLTLAYANQTLTSLNVCDVSVSSKMVMRALGHALKANSSLENLVLYLHPNGGIRSQHTFTRMLGALQQLRFNTSLKSLVLDGGIETMWFVNLVIHTINGLGENSPLERLQVLPGNVLGCAQYIEILENIQLNRTLTNLRLTDGYYFQWNVQTRANEIMRTRCYISSQQGQRLVAAVKCHYGLEHLDECVIEHIPAAGMYLRLNAAGRQYLIEDASTAAKGVEVLVKVSEDLDCLFTHLLENPLLCDIQYRVDVDLMLAPGMKRQHSADKDMIPHKKIPHGNEAAAQGIAVLSRWS